MTKDEIINTQDEQALADAVAGESRVEQRLSMGEAYMHCSDCGARLYSFDGFKDADRRCPYNGKC